MPLKLVRRPDSGVWHIRGSIDTRRVRETTGTRDRRLAEEIRAKREAELFEEARLGRRGTTPFVAAAADFLEFEERSASTHAFVQKLAKHFKATPVADIGQVEADTAVKAILSSDAAPATKVRQVYTPLIAVLNFAAARKWCDKPRIQKPKPPKGKTRWLTPAEAMRLLAATAPHIRPLLLFILCTGARMAEAIELEWKDIDLAGAKVVFRDTKTGADRVAALPPAAIAELASLPFTDEARKVKQGVVFRTDEGEPYADRNRESGGHIKTAWRGACRRAGIEPATPHDLRHSWASYFYAITKDLLLLKSEGGWASVAMCERYAHLMPAELITEIRLIWGASHPRIGRLPGVPMNTKRTGRVRSVTPAGT